MRDLSAFTDESFDLVFHPVSNLFVPEVGPVWNEAFRVLRKGGALLAGFLNPAVYVFDLELADNTGEVRVRYKSALRRCDEQGRTRVGTADGEGRAARVQPHAGGADRGSDQKRAS